MEQLSSYKKLMSQLDDCYSELADIIKSKGGIIKFDYDCETRRNLAMSKCPDFIYANVYNSSGEVVEMIIHGISVDERGEIFIATSYWDEEDSDFLDDEDNWDALCGGTYVIYASTLINIMEVIHEFI